MENEALREGNQEPSNYQDSFVDQGRSATLFHKHIK
jgi:hypothetical protein